MKKLSSRRSTQRSRKPQTEGRLDEHALLPSVDSSSARVVNGSVSGLFAKTDSRYWEQQLIHRAYGDLARPRPFREFSAKIEHTGGSCFFPLDTDAETTAAARALRIYRTILEEGWPEAIRRHAREFTLALFLAENPMIFTYTTLYTETEVLLDSEPPRWCPIRPGPKVSVAIIETETGCRWALAKWIRGLPAYSCSAVFSTGAEALLALKRRPVNLVLFNRLLPDVAAGEFLKTLQTSAPHVLTVGYRIYDTSDEMFFSQPGVSEGYYFRRRPPGSLLEPIGGACQGNHLTPTERSARVHEYVQKRFLFPPIREDIHHSSTLTSREHDILGGLLKGSPDKDIARALNISAWTVHTHLKKIYEKLGVRSRTEAVIKYLQK
jgi:DNA-binding NarL/FixJ family response regulator